ncbi:hypothetical protein [Psychroserpens mesophilus]|uniref:hypothetical protein n=1 Tax=Psychroserpens mesophilus TaxID=325473 RepID=UPI000693B438|nr:hypothetical protein [Psychroserpens mesophilus]
MAKNITATFFLILFAFLISAPTVILAIDDTADISYFYSITEEEENNTSKKISELDVIASDNIINLESLYFSNRGNSLEYRFKTYPKPHLNLISPPPEFIL